MASDLDFSPPEVPEPTFLENLLRYGLFLGAIFQLICVLAIIIPVPKSHEANPFRCGLISLVSGLICLSRTLLSVTTQEAEPSEPRSAEVMRKPKATAPSANKRPKKEAKKKR
ncbi:protein MANBAL [Moschus berezovskii]|uniref:protein MANBAL n=1 Tax=Moschus berezovskii TaxID=68408 RepID=UPI002443BFBD|nr:protein MANBAL [Moschus berezovskii]XP_055293049.1 protein MANBAL [Moschus berezovskii]XP_055293052.1 protein MANBAL [Moschus berezovskii]XP_055293058.1 protein MANBAL [Moschus berezovskii]XP_055293064.1 protein MANBAL [Moschus berezovskii]XP_055293072.1 protein MANBAL [Moschus berezovskii]XP_055293080.1 protein MANBAL [Moschus berezovskii]XP_055293090.1 protein MANBAL [Moschus berezovskii]